MSIAHYAASNYSLGQSVGFLIGQTKSVLSQAVNEELSGLGISWAQWTVLMQVHYQGESATACSACRYLDSDTGSMTRMIDRLEEKGFLKRSRNDADRRMVKLVLTDAGQALIPHMLEAVVKVLNHHLRDFTVEEVALLKSLLKRIVLNNQPTNETLPEA